MAQLIHAFVARRWAEQKRYVLDYLLGLVIKLLFFAAVLANLPRPDLATPYVWGFLLWYLAAHLLSRMGNLFLEEAYLGTLPRLLAGRHHPLAAVLAASLAEIVVTLPWVTLMLLLASLQVRLYLAWPHLWVVSLLVLLGIWGMGLALLALALEYKVIGSVIEMVIFYLLLFSGFFVDSAKLPSVLNYLNAVNPLYQGVAAMHGGSLALLAGVVSGWIIGGWLLFVCLYRAALRKGALLDY